MDSHNLPDEPEEFSGAQRQQGSRKEAERIIEDGDPLPSFY
jgi:hypothetical protein